MLSFFFGKPKSAYHPLVDETLMKKLNAIVLRSTKVETIRYIREYRCRLLSNFATEESIKGQKILSGHATLLRSLCVVFDISIKGSIQQIEKATDNILSLEEVAAFKNEISDQTDLQIKHFCLIMAEIIKSYFYISHHLLAAEPVFLSLVNALDVLRENVSEEKLKSSYNALNQIDVDSVQDEEVKAIIVEWRNRCTHTLGKNFVLNK